MLKVIVERRLSVVSVAMSCLIFAYFFESLPNFTHIVMKSFERYDGTLSSGLVSG